MAKRLKAEPPAVQSVEILAAGGAARGELRRAAQLKGFADARMRALNRARLAPYDRAYEMLCTALESALTAASLDALEAQGAQLTLDESLEMALHVAR
ncbi:MAG: hypothetical protein IAI49_07380 [Candidatus Eremiobacteraeota bacterium]|nr:hypothetical protein [Candidatus Eremiobacteraeota bacterium]